MPFRFTLQDVLEYRMRLEEMRQREFAEINRQVEHMRDLISQARALQRNYRADMVRQAAESRDISFRPVFENYIAALERLVARSLEHLAQLEQELEKARLRLLKASSERQAMEDLRKDEERRYKEQEARAERKIFDEIAIRNYLHPVQEKNAAPMGEKA